MKRLIFDPWTLQFQDVEMEKQYKQEFNKTRLLILRVMTFCVSIVTLVCLIVFVAQLQSLFLIYEMSTMFGLSFLAFIFSRKLEPYYDFVFSLFYALFLLTGVLINSSGTNVPHYIDGHGTCLLLMTTLQYCPNQMKIIYIILTPSFVLGMFGTSDVNQLQYILLTITGTVLLALYSHKMEYIQKIAFYFGLALNKQREFIHDYMSEPLIAVSLNRRSNQLELEFSNKQIEELFNTIETDQMKQFLRNSHVIQNGDSQRLDVRSSRRNIARSMTLEEYLFLRLQEKEVSQNNRTLVVVQTNKNELKQYQVQIEKLQYGHTIIMAIFQSNNIPQLQSKYENQFKLYNKSVVSLLSSIAESQQEVYTEIKDLQWNIISQKQIKSIQCSTYSIINKIKNFLVFFQQERVPFLKQYIESCQFEAIVATVQHFFQNKSINKSKQFQLTSQMPQDLELKINLRLLIQITINCFEQALNQSVLHSTIILMISEEQNLDPLKQKGDTLMDIESNPQTLKLIKFSFIYYSAFRVQLEPENDKIDCNNLGELRNLDLQINFPVSCVLLGIIGPYNRIQTKQVDLENSQFLNTLSFYIYSDQTLLDQSFTRNITQKIRFNF